MKKLLLAALLLSLSVCAFAQQDYVGRYDAFAGFSYLDSPKLNLQQRGFDTQVGVNLKKWLAAGFDYSIEQGHTVLKLKDLNQATLVKLAPVLPLVPPAPYVLFVPFDATTQTFTAGPQLVYRHFKKVTFFAHPSIGAIHEGITLKSHDAVTAALVPLLPALGVAKSTKPSDLTYFYGLGGGADYNLTRHFHLRADVEFVHVFLFKGILLDSRNTLRVSVGPTFNFGRNIVR